MLRPRFSLDCSRLGVALVASALVACRSGDAGPAECGPYALLLGTAQDGGKPQIGCEGSCCAGARSDPERRARVVSLLVADPRGGKRFLLDASPDLADQVELARGHPPQRAPQGPRPPLFERVFLTHAHMGHYAGLLQLGREAYGAGGLALGASERMAGFLRANAPWSALFGEGGAELEVLVPGRPVSLGDGLTLTPLAVPHRDEFSDTLAFRIDGPRRSLLYAPDTDGWERWDPPIESLLAEVDIALLDGTFFDAGEVLGRDLSAIPHPFLRASIERFSALPPSERAKIRFVHLNHTNPAWDPGSAAAGALREAGLRLGREGEGFEL